MSVSRTRCRNVGWAKSSGTTLRVGTARARTAFAKASAGSSRLVRRSAERVGGFCPRVEYEHARLCPPYDFVKPTLRRSDFWGFGKTLASVFRFSRRRWSAEEAPREGALRLPFGARNAELRVSLRGHATPVT